MATYGKRPYVAPSHGDIMPPTPRNPQESGGLLSPDAIKKHIYAFEVAAHPEDKARNPRKFYARGAYLSGVRDDLANRLSAGWAFLEAQSGNSATLSATADFWFELLGCYEKINDLLNEHGTDDMREHAARLIYDGIPEYESTNISRPDDASPNGEQELG